MKKSIGFLILLFCNMGFALGSCLSYGHSCWGAHGKRSSPQKVVQPHIFLSDRWALFKLAKEGNEFKSNNYKTVVFPTQTADNEPLSNQYNNRILNWASILSNSAIADYRQDETINSSKNIPISPKDLNHPLFQEKYNKPQLPKAIIDTVNYSESNYNQNMDDILDLRNFRLIM